MKKPPIDPGKLLSVEEVATRLGVSLSRVRTLCQDERFGTKVGRDWVITEGQLAAYLAEGPRKGGRPRGSGG